jgi:hypothetical protein
MSNQKKIESNRRNTRKGCRRRKSRSCLNARKHGLSVPIMADRKLQAEALEIARAIVEESSDEELLEQALVVAETELDLRRIQEARKAAIEFEIRHEERKGAVDEASRYSAQQQFCFGAFVRAIPALKQIDRYERRVYARRDKAMVRLNGQKLLAHCLAKQR